MFISLMLKSVAVTQESLTAPDPNLNLLKASENMTFFFFRSSTMFRRFIPGLAHNALYLLRFRSDVQQIPLQT